MGEQRLVVVAAPPGDHDNDRDQGEGWGADGSERRAGAGRFSRLVVAVVHVGAADVGVHPMPIISRWQS